MPGRTRTDGEGVVRAERTEVMPTPPLSKAKHAKIHALIGKGLTLRKVAKKAGVSYGTAYNFAKNPLPTATAAELPESWAETYTPFVIDGAYKCLILSDVHIPFHTREAVEAAVDAGKRAGCGVVLLNGDALDCHNVSRYDHDGSKLTYQQEIEYGRQFFAYLRGQFPKARIIFKEGNHEERLSKYILSRAPALFGINDCTLESLVGLENCGVEFVGEQRVVHAGNLRVIHGHEYGGGVNAPVNAARWLMMRARKPAIMGHLHQTSEQIERNIDGDQLATWSVGCLCGLSPRYRRLNAKWNWGAAIVDVSRDKSFSLRNMRISGGKVI